MPEIKAILRKDYNKKGESSILLVTHFKGKKVRINTGISVLPCEFDEKKGIVKLSNSQAPDYNLIIASCLARINNILVKYRLLHEELTPDQLISEYKIKSTYIDFYGFMRNEILSRKGELTASTIKLQLSILHKLQSFRKRLVFSEITEEFIKKFQAYLKLKLKNGPGTVGNALKIFKTYIHIAIKKEIITRDPFAYISTISSRPDRLFLTESEIKTLLKVYSDGKLLPAYQKTLRAYLFSCCTGLRISDIKLVSMENIINNTLVIYPFKTRTRKREPVKIPITIIAKRIIESELPHVNGKIFDVSSDQKMNTHIKAIASGSGINKNLSFHSARHTFATYFLRKTKNLAALQKLMGHSNIRETMIYAHVLMDDIEKEMKCFDSLNT
jgi:integrase/recombinase XerD